MIPHPAGPPRRTVAAAVVTVAGAAAAGSPTAAADPTAAPAGRRIVATPTDVIVATETRDLARGDGVRVHSQPRAAGVDAAPRVPEGQGRVRFRAPFVPGPAEVIAGTAAFPDARLAA